VRFENSVRIIQPKHAIPFAGNVCHLHSETFRFNRHNITPTDVSARCRQVFGAGSPVVLMAPGDSWNAETGFHISAADEYSDPDRALSKLSESAQPLLKWYYKEEGAVAPDFHLFRDYMREFIRALPVGIQMVFQPVIVFDQPTADHRYWVVDFSRHTVFETGQIPPNANSVIVVHPAVLMDAVTKSILFFVHISKRMRVWVRKGGMKEEFKFWGLLQLYETGYLPLRNMISPRAVPILWRRRYEILELLRSSLRSGRFEEKAVPEVY
jgi:hypothetical protein